MQNKAIIIPKKDTNNMPVFIFYKYSKKYRREGLIFPGKSGNFIKSRFAKSSCGKKD